MAKRQKRRLFLVSNAFRIKLRVASPNRSANKSPRGVARVHLSSKMQPLSVRMEAALKDLMVKKKKKVRARQELVVEGACTNTHP